MGVYQSPVANIDWIQAEFDKRDRTIADLTLRAQAAAQVTEFQTGVVASANYVLFDGDATVYPNALRWQQGYTPVAGDPVLLGRVGGEWIILSKLKSSTTSTVPVVLPPASGWTSYDAEDGPSYNPANALADRFSPGVASKSSTGWVTAYGLYNKTSGTSVGGVITTLPLGMRPATPMPFVAVNNTSAQVIIVNPDGTVTAGSALAAGWVSIGNIQFNVDLTYAALSYHTTSPQWVNFGSPYAAPAIAQDAYGFVSTIGAAKSGLTTDATPVFDLASSMRPALASIGHITTVTGSGMGGMSPMPATTPLAQTANTLEYRSFPTNSNTFWSIAGGFWDSGGAGIPWLAPHLINSWIAYGSSWATPGYYARLDGLVALRGLYGSGTIGGVGFTLPVGLRPHHRVVRGVLSNAAFGRADIYPDGTVTFLLGSNAWFSLDGILFAAAA